MADHWHTVKCIAWNYPRRVLKTGCLEQETKPKYYKKWMLFSACLCASKVTTHLQAIKWSLAIVLNQPYR
jgi:hypothetical protein